MRLEGITDMGLVESLASEGGLPCLIICPGMKALFQESEKFGR